MKAVVAGFVRACVTCQMAKLERVKYPGLLQHLPVPDGAWQIISMDFIEGLSVSSSYNCILVIVDKFTKFAHFLPLKHPYTPASVAKVFLDSIYKLHGMPESIVSNRDRVLTNSFWNECLLWLKYS
jgi:hypothetical protein